MRWAPFLLIAALGCLAVGVQAAQAPAGGPSEIGDPILEDAVDWLLEKRGSTGCVETGEDEEPSQRSTAWTSIAVSAAGRDPDEGEASLIDGLREACPPDTDGGSMNELNALSRHVLAIVAAGENPRDFGGEDWIERVRSHHAGNQFVDANHPNALNDDAFAILALRAAGVSSGDQMVDSAGGHLLGQQNDDGGWGLSGGGSSSTDMTAVVVEALTLSGHLAPADDAAKDALGYLLDRAGKDHGCLSDGYATSANRYSTAWAIRALPALHTDPRGEAWTSQGSAWDCLRATATEQGGFASRKGDDPSLWMTWEAVPALAGIPHGRVDPSLATPSASLSTSSTPTEGQATTLVAEDAAFAAWALPTGELLEGQQADWRPEQAGEVQMSVLVVDEVARAWTQPFQTTVEEAETSSSSSSSSSGSTSSGSSSGSSSSPAGSNEAEGDADSSPVEAALIVPTTAERNVTFTIEVEGEGSKQPVTGYRIDVPGAEATEWQPAGRFEVTLDQLGNHSIQAWARDAGDNVSPAASASVEIVDAAPRVRIEGPQLVHRSMPIDYHAKANDPDGPPPGITWQLSTEGARIGQAAGANATLSFATPGPHTIEAIARDEANNTARATYEVDATRNRAPVNVTVTPRALAANASEVVQAEAEDPDGDQLDYAWRPEGAASAISWGRQWHVDAGAPGQRVVHLNVSDPYGGWTRAEIVLPVREDPAEQADQAAAIVEETSHAPTPPSSSEASMDEGGPARVELPERIEAQPGQARLIEGQASSPTGQIVNVSLWLGDRLPVRGTSNFTALAPQLSAGAYELAARAADGNGWGPWTNTTLVVHAPAHAHEEALAPANTSQARQAPVDALAASLALALASCLVTAMRRRGS